ncbi:MAG TPA: tetratricopeptide repeat protein [Sphingomonadaceae bacterium]|nr:tetratricopeptide repeat protein [Sphingomonadaceae bacterium]
MKFAAYALLGAAVASAAPALADVRAGVEAYQRGDYARALAEWRPLADKGDADAQFNLAQAYKLGRGVPANLDTALGFYRKAAAQNHEEAQALLGLLLFQNGKRAEAMPWLGKAADRGDAASQYVYGTALFNGDMVGKDWPRAYALMTRAAAQGLPPARNAVVEMDKHIPLAQREQGVAMARAADDRPAASRPAPVRTAAATTPATVRPAPAAAPAAGVTRQPPANPAVRDTGPPARPTAVAAAPRTTAPRTAPAARPTPVPAARPAPAATRVAGWKVQLGAFRESGAANALFSSLKGRVRALSGAQPILVRAGAVTRLQAGPFASRAAAASACAQITAAGQACFPVAP